MNTKKDSFTIEVCKVNTQSGLMDCGLFASAYCTSLAHGQDPSAVIYDQSKMRDHLLECIENKKMALFPVSRNKRVSSKFITVCVYCICRSPYTGEKMVCCDKCKQWYHTECIKEPIFEEKEKWYCDACSSN